MLFNFCCYNWLPGMSQSFVAYLQCIVLLNLLFLAKHCCSSLDMWWVLGCVSLYLGPKKTQCSGMWYCGVYPVTPGLVAPSMHALSTYHPFVPYLHCIVFCCHNPFLIAFSCNWLLAPLLAKSPSSVHFIALIYKHFLTLSKWLVPIPNEYIIILLMQLGAYGTKWVEKF